MVNFQPEQVASFTRISNFILEAPQKLYPLEVNKSGKSTRALYAFMSYYKEDKGYVVYPGAFSEKGNICFIPVWWIA